MDLRRELQAVGAIWAREFKVFQREKSRVVSAIATPLIWLLFVGSGFGRTIDEDALGGVDYMSFMFPGVVAMSVLFGTVFYGVYIIWDRKLDVLKEVLVAPVSRVTVFVGKVVGGSTEAIIQSAIVLTIGIFAIGLQVGDIILAMGVVLLMAVGFVSVGLIIGSFFESLEGFQTIVTFLLFPMFFMSGALFPVDGLPDFLRIPTLLNPMTYGVDALRGILIGVHSFSYVTDLAVLTGFAVLTIAIGTWSFNRMR